jgi:hypothetical protein
MPLPSPMVMVWALAINAMAKNAIRNNFFISNLGLLMVAKVLKFSIKPMDAKQKAPREIIPRCFHRIKAFLILSRTSRY